MDSIPQGQKRVLPYLFNQLEPINKQIQLSWSNLKSYSSFNMENISNSKSFWFKLKSDTSYNITNISNKTSWSNFKSDSSYNIETTSSNNKSNNTDSALMNNKKDITTEENLEHIFWAN